MSPNRQNGTGLAQLTYRRVALRRTTPTLCFWEVHRVGIAQENMQRVGRLIRIDTNPHTVHWNNMEFL